LNPLNEGKGSSLTSVEIIGKNLTALGYMTKDLIQRHHSKLLKQTKKTAGGLSVGEEAEHFLRTVEETLFEKGWGRFQDWADVQEVIINKSGAKEDTGEQGDREEASEE
jgi:hypothetical protein